MHLADYHLLIQAYLDEMISIEFLDSHFNFAYFADANRMPTELYEIFQDIFCVLEMYSPNWPVDDDGPVQKYRYTETRVREDLVKDLALLDDYISRQSREDGGC